MSNTEGSWDRKKLEISSSFGTEASYYDQHAKLQREVADRLIASLEPWQSIIPPGPIIELGCGTGFVTEGLAKLYPNRNIEATDLSPGMIDYSKKKFESQDNVAFKIRDAERTPSNESNEPHYALTVSGFTAHWLKDPALTFGHWLEATKPGGLLLASFPGNESFPEWRRLCRELGLPFTGNTLPDVEEMVIKMSVGAQVDYYEDSITLEFDSALNFFQELKNTGAGVQIRGRTLTRKELSLLINHWDSSSNGTVKVTYHLVFLAVKRD